MKKTILLFSVLSLISCKDYTYVCNSYFGFKGNGKELRCFEKTHYYDTYVVPVYVWKFNKEQKMKENDVCFQEFGKKGLKKYYDVPCIDLDSNVFTRTEIKRATEDIIISDIFE